MTSIASSLERCHTAVVHDALRELGHVDQVLPHAIRLLDPTTVVSGPAFTVEGAATAELDDHETLVRWTRFLAAVPAGTAVVCQANDDTVAHMGELSAEALLLKGVRGFVVDGGCRDTETIVSLGFPVACRYTTPADVVGRWAPTALGEPVTIGGVRVATGDLVLVDRDGGVVVPASVADEVVARAEEMTSTESLVRRAIREGAPPDEAYEQFGKF